MHENNITSSNLLYAIQKSTSKLVAHLNDYEFDQVMLREFCGCLITVMSEERKFHCGAAASRKDW